MDFNPKEHLNLVDEMIMSTRNEIRENGFQYLYWGWLVFFASLTHYVLLKVGFQHPYVAWTVMPAGTIVGILLIRKEVRSQRVRTWLDRMMKYIWISFGVCLFITLTMYFKLGHNTYPMVLLIYGIGTFLSGGALKFKPLLAGGIFCWTLAIACFFVSFENQLLLLAAALLGAYIIPGYLLKKQYEDVQ